MRASTFVVVSLVAMLVAALVLTLGVGTAAAHEPCVDAGLPGNSDYGRLHIAGHTPHGISLGEHNPGTHQGYSLCLGVHG